MHLNYHFLKFLCPELDRLFRGKEVTACFSQNKNELILEAKDENGTQYLKAHLNPPQIYLAFPDDFKRAKRNSMNFFKELIGEKITGCELLSFERAFYFSMDSGKKLLFKLHGNRSNVLMYLPEANVPEKTFRNELVEDKSLDWNELEKDLDLSFDQFEKLEGNASKFLPTLGTFPRRWLKDQGYLDSNLLQRWEMMVELMDMLETPLFSLVEESGEVRLSLLPEADSISTFSNPVQAVNELYYQALIKGSFEKEKNTLLKKYQEQLKRQTSYIEKSSQKLLELRDSAPPSNLADVVMANLHLFENGKSEVELFDFYSGKQVKVALKPNQKPQDFAASLYRKSKNRKLEWKQIEKTIENKRAVSEALKSKIDALIAIDDYRGLKEFKKKHGEDKAIQKETESLPFKVFELEGYTIWVGKSAQSNDDMLREYAKKDDLWLHARMVSGSHVLVKNAVNHPAPTRVLEAAAQLAAFYSKNKTESLAPVIYTPVKFVRKVKGSAPGSVVVEKEKVILVQPAGPEVLFGKEIQ
ncbi:NFACT RNA binding domain-containing protein [Algoriphagus marinus]|uniref:NFACT RNA binding domain-containing protein n=1 Tax=Algoriphagus marinus TaxID=1925762 RepID=UPI00094B9EE8|nr:NFACT RNA binding domain-containing protein [Algoriphagus marinus]